MFHVFLFTSTVSCVCPLPYGNNQYHGYVLKLGKVPACPLQIIQLRKQILFTILSAISSTLIYLVCMYLTVQKKNMSSPELVTTNTRYVWFVLCNSVLKISVWVDCRGWLYQCYECQIKAFWVCVFVWMRMEETVEWWLWWRTYRYAILSN